VLGFGARPGAQVAACDGNQLAATRRFNEQRDDGFRDGGERSWWGGGWGG
jgi:hypothetical protein